MKLRLGAALLLALALLAGLPASAAANFAGTWKLLPVNPPEGEAPREAVLVLKQEGEKITGTVTADGREMSIQNATISGNDLRFTVVAERDGATIEAKVRITLNGDSLKGTAEGPEERTLEFTGTRAPQPAAALSGAWSLTIETPNRTYKPTLTLVQEGEKLTGALRTEEGMEVKLLSGSVKGDTVAFAVDVMANGQVMHLEFSGKRGENGLKGEMRVDEQSFSWSGTRAVSATAPAK